MDPKTLGKILIADDEKALARAVELKLNYSGFNAKSVSNGREVLDILKKEKFDLILLDLIMPEMDGFEVIAELQKTNLKTPIIVTSNLSQEEDINKAKEMGIKDYFIKSDTPISKIVEIVKNKLNIKE